MHYIQNIRKRTDVEVDGSRQCSLRVGGDIAIGLFLPMEDVAPALAGGQGVDCWPPAR